MYTLIGTRADESGKIEVVSLFDEKKRTVLNGDYEGFISAGIQRLAIRNFDKEKMEPFGGWDAYAKYDKDGNTLGDNIWVLLGAMPTGEYLIVDSKGDLRSLTHYIALLEFAENNTLRNWYGYSIRNGRPFYYGEEKAIDDIALGCPSDMKTKPKGDRQRRSVNKLPKEKGGVVEFSDGTTQATFKTSGMGDEELVKAWTKQYLGETNHCLDEAKTEHMEKTYLENLRSNESIRHLFDTKQYTWDSNKKNTKITAFPYDTDNGVRYGLCLEYSKDTKSAAWVIAPAIYTHISVIYSGTWPVAVAQKESGDLEFISLRTSYTVTELSTDVKKQQVKDYMCILSSTTPVNGQLLIGCATNTEGLYRWYPVAKDLIPVKEITCRMALTGQNFKDSRCYTGNVSVTEFTDVDGMTVILNMKDYSYDSRITFNRNNALKASESEKEEALPEWADIILDFTASSISIRDSFGEEKAVKTFVNLSPEILSLMGGWFGATATVPVEKEIEVRRHTEKHEISTFSRVNYDKVLSVMGVLGRFEKYSDVSTLMNYCSFNSITTAEKLVAEFDIGKSFHEVATCGDGKKLYMKSSLVCLNQAPGANNKSTTFGMLLMFFWRRGAGIQTANNIIFKGGLSADPSKVSLSDENLEAFVELATAQQVQGQAYNMLPISTTVLQTVEGAGLKAPRYVTESYTKAHTAVHDANSDLKLLMTDWNIKDGEELKTSARLFFGFYDGLAFRATKDELPSKDEAEVSTSERAKIYNNVMNTNKPLLTSKMPAVFKVALS